MKKTVLILALITSFNAYTYEGTISQSGSCGATDADCHYDLYDDGHLEISGSGEMSHWDYSLGHAAPWAPDNSQGRSPVTSVNIDGITNIGQWAFLWCRELTDVQISDTVKTISSGAFENTGFSSTLIIPESVQRINGFAFSGFGNAKIVIEGNPQLKETTFFKTANATIYCQSELQCAGKGVLNGVNSSGGIITYEKQNGVYILGDGSMFASANNMTNETDACTDLDSCKAKVLKNKGYCTSDESCVAIVDLENANAPIEYKNKSYASIDDLLKGKYLPKRIYTIDEANRVAGKVNSVKIRYR